MGLVIGFYWFAIRFTGIWHKELQRSHALSNAVWEDNFSIIPATMLISP